MSNHLTLLRTNHCREATLVESAEKDLFPLERDTEQAKTILGRAPSKSLSCLEFDPLGLKQTYRDEETGAELPVFAVFNLDGSNHLHAYVGAMRKTSYGAALNLANHLPFAKTQAFVRSLNQNNLKAWRVATICYVLLAAFAAVAIALRDGPQLLNDAVLSSPHRVPEVIFEVLGVSGAAFIATLLLGFLLTAAIVNKLFPPKTLSLTATFDGILPKETRVKALRTRDLFDNLYLVVDQQKRWKSDFLSVPASALLDPLLIGEKREKFRSRYYLIDQFELTSAEDYLAAEFVCDPR